MYQESAEGFLLQHSSGYSRVFRSYGKGILRTAFVLYNPEARSMHTTQKFCNPSSLKHWCIGLMATDIVPCCLPATFFRASESGIGCQDSVKVRHAQAQNRISSFNGRGSCGFFPSRLLCLAVPVIRPSCSVLGYIPPSWQLWLCCKAKNNSA